ncbi:ankyrin repeat-containing domain protein [Mycena alexandri]|uniref:Ankyrin repeat-containing domain protein n=1 Tax=Mycena alexandri TaxID=1745969 RepID=A0AAD6X043_9AGAR|nr:ankyrin repeat-containing domain protein [Mycena alexandri]
MAEAFATLGIVVNLIQLVDTALKAREYIGDFRHAPQEQRRLLSEMDDLRPLLAQLQTRINSNPSGSIIQEIQNPLMVFRGTMEGFTTRLRPSNGALAKFSKQLSWSMWSKSEAKEYLTKFEQFKSLLNSWLLLDIWDMGQQQGKEYGNIINALDNVSDQQRLAHNQILAGIGRASSHQQKNMDSAQRTEIMQWMTPLNFFQRQADILNTWQAGTGEWLLEDPLFREWESGAGQVVWCRGMAGAGKTVLSSRVVDHLESQSWKSNTGVACIYLNHKETETQTPSHLLGALWRQLVVGKPISPVVLELYDHSRERATRPSLDDVSTALNSALEQYSKTYLVVDALDEYPEDRRNILLQCLSTAIRGPTSVKLMLTSRPHLTLDTFFQKFETLEIRATEEDIGRYVDVQISKWPRLSRHVHSRPELQDEIRRKMIRNVDGMFLLAKLHIESLATKNTVKAVRTALQNLPTDLKHTYDDAMGRINSQNDDDKQLARLTLTWVAYAKRLLTVAELCEALAIEPTAASLDADNMLDIDVVLSVCSGLIIVDAAMSVVRFVHYTTQHYFDRIQPVEFPDAQLDITAASLTYLSFNTFHTLPDPEQYSLYEHSMLAKELLARHPFMAYGQYCLIHAVGRPEADLCDQILSFLPRAPVWKQFWDSAAYTHGGHDVGRRLIPPWNYPDWLRSPSPLWISAAFNLVEIARTLLMRSAAPGDGVSALWAASFYGHLAMVRLLIEQGGVDVNARLEDGRYGTALQAAASMGRTSEAPFSLNMDRAGVVEVTVGYGGSALQGVSPSAHEDIVRLLLEKGADVNLRAGRLGSALQVAAYWDHKTLVRLLIDHGADVNCRDGGPFGNALQAAAYDGHEALVRLLIDIGADVNLQGGEYGSALYAAAVQGHEEIVRLLIDNGADVNALGGDFGRDYGSALQVSLSRGNIAKLLIENGAELGYTSFGSPLQAAAAWGLYDVARLLIEHGADVNVQGGKYSPFATPLQEASWGDHVDLVRLLIDSGAEVNAEGTKYGSALQAAIRRGYENIAVLLREKGASVTLEAENSANNDAARSEGDLLQA